MDYMPMEVKQETNYKEKKGRGGAITGFIVATVAAIVIIVGWFIWLQTDDISTGNARITTNFETVQTWVPGYIENMEVYQGQEVRAGEVLGTVVAEQIIDGESVTHREDLVSPMNGIIVQTNIRPNYFASAGEPLLIIADTENIHIQANIYETDIRDVYVGQATTVTLDVFGNRTFRGYVSNISRLTELELMGAPVHLSTGGTFRRIAHTFPIEITLTTAVDLSYFLGSNAEVTLHMNQNDND